ncbi:filamentous hemagglutinin N-terminal domain-containing protein [Roseateles sp.]|uniref:two-partner secretion domain-containing protein n=1 Tax=Roseateles sp. TaxID=1971397 RepID=UPI0031D0B24A
MDIRNSRGQGRVSARTRGLVAAMAAAGLLTLAGPALASLPQGHEVRAGQVVPETVGNTMTIRQTSQAAKLDWKSFDIGKDHAVRIEQPNREAFIVNRVTGTTRSQIDGSLTANGRVYLVNPNGVVFGSEAKVDVGGLVAAGVRLADEQMAGEREPQLTRKGATGDIEHSGLIVVREGGVARLVGGEVNLRAGSSVRASGADVVLEADATRESGGSVRMEKGAAVYAFGGKVFIHNEHVLALGNIRTHDLNISGISGIGYYQLKRKAYDGTRRAVGDGARFSRVRFTDDSTLRLAFEFNDLQPGLQSATPKIEFKDWLGSVVDTAGHLPPNRNATATIEMPGSHFARQRIDLPQLEKTLVGDVTVGAPVDKTLTITQRDDYAVLDWKSFNVAEGHAVKFVQKDSQALAVNRINDTEGSRIHGRIDANGRVFLFNPEGVLFSRTAEVNVGGLVAAGFALSNEQVPYSREAWALSSQSTTASVVNEGRLNVRGGDATLASPAGLRQDGVIDMVGGTASLIRAGAFKVTRAGGSIEPSVLATTQDGTLHRGRTRAIEGGNIRLWDWSPNNLNGPIDRDGRCPVQLLLSGAIEVIGQGALQIIAKQTARIEGQLRPGRQIDLQGLWTVSPESAEDGEISGRRVASWLDVGSQVRIEHTGVVSGINDDISADGTEDSSLTIHNVGGGLHLHKNIRLRRGSLTLRSTDDLIEMDKGTSIATPGGGTRLIAGGPLTLSSVSAKSLAVEVPLALKFQAKDKVYNSDRVAEPEELTFSGIEIHDGSNLSLLKRYRYDSAEVGEKRVVSPHFAIKGFNGDVEAPLKVTVDPESITTARILPSPLPVMGETPSGIGDRAIASSPNTTTITQKTPYLWMDWLSFDIAKDHSVVFKQDRPDWLAVNRVTSARPSVIDGSLRADGRVYLLNPNGITFGSTSKVDVGGLVAAAMTAPDDALMRAPTPLALSGSGSAEVANHGEIKIAKGGVATLAAPGVLTQAGQVTAPEGAIHVASTERMTIDGQGKIAQVDGERLEVRHAGTTSANDGEVAIYGGQDDVIDGVVEAKGRGRIELAGTLAPLWDLKGEILPGEGMLLSEVVYRVGQRVSSGIVSSEQLAQWLNAGSDVEFRPTFGIVMDDDIETKPDASGRLTFSAEGSLDLARIKVPRLTIQTPLRVAFDARDKTFDGSTRSEFDGLEINGVRLRDGSNLRLIPTFDFDSADPGERLVSARVFLTGYHGDEKQELQVIHDDSPEGLRRRTATIFPKVDPGPMPDPDGTPGPGPEPVVPGVPDEKQKAHVIPATPLRAAKRGSLAVDGGCIVDRDERQPPGRLCEQRLSDGPRDRPVVVRSREIRLNESNPSPKHAP